MVLEARDPYDTHQDCFCWTRDFRRAFTWGPARRSSVWHPSTRKRQLSPPARCPARYVPGSSLLCRPFISLLQGFACADALGCLHAPTLRHRALLSACRRAEDRFCQARARLPLGRPPRMVTQCFPTPGMQALSMYRTPKVTTRPQFRTCSTAAAAAAPRRRLFDRLVSGKPYPCVRAIESALASLGDGFVMAPPGSHAWRRSGSNRRQMRGIKGGRVAAVGSTFALPLHLFVSVRAAMTGVCGTLPLRPVRPPTWSCSTTTRGLRAARARLCGCAARVVAAARINVGGRIGGGQVWLRGGGGVWSGFGVVWVGDVRAGSSSSCEGSFGAASSRVRRRVLV